MKTSLSKWRNKIPIERKLFSRTTPTFFTTSIVNTENEIRGLSPINYWIDNMVNKRQHSVWAERDSYSSINQYTGPLYANGTFPTGPDDEPTV